MKDKIIHNQNLPRTKLKKFFKIIFSSDLLLSLSIKAAPRPNSRIDAVKNPPFNKMDEIDHLKAPFEILKNADFTNANKLHERTDKFIIAWTTVRPFERMQFLVGTENLFLELASASRHFLRLRDIVHEFFLKELEMWVNTDVDAIMFMDDWALRGVC